MQHEMRQSDVETMSMIGETFVTDA
jgi:hypothetical protein